MLITHRFRSPLSLCLAGILAVGYLTSILHAHPGHGANPGPIAPKRKPIKSTVVDRDPNVPQLSLAANPPHAGQVVATSMHYFEVVYLPKQIRLYLYSSTQALLSTKRVRGELMLQVRSSQQVFRYPLKYIPPTDSTEDYLGCDIDLTHVRDGDMDVTVSVSELPQRRERSATFQNSFALTRQASPVATVPSGSRGLNLDNSRR